MSPGPATSPGGAPAAARPIWTALVCALLAAAAIAAWSNSFHGAFVYDDLGAIRDNPTLRHFPSLRALTPPQQNTLARRPIANLSLAINYAIGGPDVLGFHVGNLLIHLCVALVLFGMVRRTLWTAWMKMDPRGQDLAAFVVALLWAVHPIQTESVTYIVQRTESLAGLFYLLTLYCAIRGALSVRAWRWYSLSIAACALGMGAKETVATAPLIVLLYDRCFLSESFREALRRRRVLYIGLAATWAVLIALLVAYPWGAGTGAGFGLPSLTAWQYARTQPGVLLHYLRLAFWPHPLCLDYAWPVATGAWQILPAAAVVAALVGTFWALRRAPAIGFLGAWFFVILAPTSSIMPIQDPCFEHRMYLPLAAVVAGFVLAMHWAASRRWTAKWQYGLPLQVAAGTVFLSVAVALGCATYARNETYRDAISIWQDAVAQRPDNVRALTNLGYSYASAGRFGEAIIRFDRAIELNPRYAVAYDDRAEARIHLGRYAQALADCDAAAELQPSDAEARVHRGDALLLTHRREEAIRAYGEAIALAPKMVLAYHNRAAAFAEAGRLDDALRDLDAAAALDPDSAEILCQRASVSTRLGRFDEAIRDCDSALALNPIFAEAYNNRATARLAEGRCDQALLDAEKAISLKPDFALAFANRGDVFLALNRFPEALDSYDQAITLMPGLAAAYRNRAAIYFSVNRMAEAIRDYTQLIALKPDSAEARCDRANAYIRTRQYDAAIADCDQAIALKPDYAPAYGARAAANAGRGMYDLVLRDCTRAIALKPDYAAAYNNRAYAFYQLKNYDKALADIDEYRRLGGRPEPNFLKGLLRAAGRAE